jgi:hypothetical protein
MEPMVAGASDMSALRMQRVGSGDRAYPGTYVPARTARTPSPDISRCSTRAGRDLLGVGSSGLHDPFRVAS